MNITTSLFDSAPIVFGMNLSVCDDIHLEVALELARRVAAPLVLAHALELPVALHRDARTSAWVMARRNRSVLRVAERLGKRGVSVDARVRLGRPAVVLAATGAAMRARLIVVHSMRRRNWERWLSESVAKEMVVRTRTPSMVLREPGRLGKWLRGERPLKVFVCFNDTRACGGALAWVRHLSEAGPVEVVLGGVGSGDAAECIRDELDGIPVERRIAPRSGRVVARLLEMAREECADLIVAGAERRSGWRGVLRRSVSAGLVARSGANVVVVPDSWSRGVGASEGFPASLETCRVAGTTPSGGTPVPAGESAALEAV